MMKDGLAEYTGEGRITLQVAAQIIQRISSGLYRSPESALKELVSNAFDADSPEVRIQFYFSKNQSGEERLSRVVVRDIGNGMNIENLKYVFTHVGGSQKETKDFQGDPTTPKGRPLIGRLGIGMLSIASACDVFRVRTKKKGESREYLAEISLDYLKKIELRTQSMDLFSIGNVGLYSKSVTNEFDQYTEVEIREFRPPFMESIQSDLEKSFIYQNGRLLEVEGENADEKKLEDFFLQLMEWTFYGGQLMDGTSVRNPGRLQSAHPLDAAALNIGLMAPIQYLSDGPVRKEVTYNGKKYKISGTDESAYQELKDRYKEFRFNVYFESFKETNDGRVYPKSRFKIYKPILYPRDTDLQLYGFDALNPKVFVIKPLQTSVVVEEGVKTDTLLTGYYYHQNRRIVPQEFRGVLFRVYNVSIGSKFVDDLKLYVTNSVILWQSLCEIYLDKGFQRIVNLDRESLYEGNNVYRHVKYFLENLLTGSIPEKLVQGPGAQSSPTEREFSQTERSLFKESEGLIRKIKSGFKKPESSGMEEPWDIFKTELLTEEQCTSLKVTGRTGDPSKISVTKKGKVLNAVLPIVHDDKMWDSIFITLYLNIADLEREKRVKILQEILDLYREWSES